MTHRIDIQHETRTVRVTHLGDVDLIDMESGRAQAVALLAQHGYSRMLVDTREVVRHPSPTEHHRFASSHPLYMPPHVAVAVVVKQDEFNRPRLFEQMAVQQGVLMKAFDNLEDAQAWLARITN